MAARSKTVVPMIGLLIVVLTVMAAWAVFSKRTLPPDTHDFQLASKGDYWLLSDDDIPVRQTPRLEANEVEFLENLVTFIGGGIKVKVLETSDGWVNVFVYTTDGTVPRGWILAEAIEDAQRIIEGR